MWETDVVHISSQTVQLKRFSHPESWSTLLRNMTIESNRNPYFFKKSCPILLCAFTFAKIEVCETVLLVEKEYLLVVH